MKLTIPELGKKKKLSEPIVMLSVYDATMAKIADDAGIDILLVGDSLGMLIQGHDSTLSVTIDEMIYHTRAVRRGCRRAHLVADMPFLSYQPSPRDAVLSAGRFLKEAAAEAVKIEGGAVQRDTVRAMVDAGIPVMGHIGLEPQRVHHYGGYKIQGTTAESSERILNDAQVLVEAGVYSIVLEGVPEALAARITSAIPVPTIGIASGPHCDGQVLVSYDLWGLNPDFKARFAKRYCDGYSLLGKAVEQFAEDVRKRRFPDKNHTPK